MIETNRLIIYPASKEQMEAFIAVQSVDVLKAAYTEMLDGSLVHPDQWVWYAIWMIEKKDGDHIGELCFKGIDESGSTEIGYGIVEEYQGNGYATEAISALTGWALEQTGVTCITAETEESNIASQRVLKKSGFIPTGEDTSKEIIVGAHYDSDGDSDNASGVALLLATAVGLKNEKFPVTVKYVFFDAEEIGTLGSKFFLDHMSDDEKESIIYMINMDSIGYGDYCNIYGGSYNEVTHEVTGTDAYEYAMRKAGELGYHVYDTEDLNGYFKEHEKGPELDSIGVFTNPWTYENPSPLNFMVASPCAYPSSDAGVFEKAGIPYIMFDSVNWYARGKTENGISYSVYYDTIDTSIGLGGKTINTEYDTLSYLEEHFPGRAVEHFNLFSPILSSLILQPDTER